MITKPTFRLDFCDFWDGWDKTDNYFTRILRQRFRVELSSRPDFVICCDRGGDQYRLHSCVRISFDGEGRPPDFGRFDYALTSDYSADPRHLRLPLYVFYGRPEDLIKTAAELQGDVTGKDKFCAFVIGHTARRTRNRIAMFERLGRYRRVDSGGRALNNIGGPLPAGAKHDFLLPYKFNLAYENMSKPGYTTEKLGDAMRARCIPIYWGSPLIHTEFNPKSFINALDFPDAEALARHIERVDQDDALYRSYLREPFFAGNRPNEFYGEDRLLDFFERIYSTPIKPVGQRRVWLQLGRWVCARKTHPARPAHWA